MSITEITMVCYLVDKKASALDDNSPKLHLLGAGKYSDVTDDLSRYQSFFENKRFK